MTLVRVIVEPSKRAFDATLVWEGELEDIYKELEAIIESTELRKRLPVLVELEYELSRYRKKEG